jgi:ribosomal protein L37E
MNTLICHRCGGHEFDAVEFRNTRTNKIIFGQEQVALICPRCSLVVWNINGRATASCVDKKAPKHVRQYLRRRI